MTNILLHILEINVAITLSFIIYQLMFRKDSNFNSRRGFLLLSMLLSIVVPFLSFNITQPIGNFDTAVISLEEIIVTGSAAGEQSVWPSVGKIALLLYASITIFFLGKLFISIANVIVHAIKAPRIKLNEYRITVSRNFHASSFFHYIFLDPTALEDEDSKMILKHESYHVRLWHSVDRILAEIILSLSWFNPVAWMLRRAIVVNHEYQADNRVIERGTDLVSYQLSILNQYIGSASITNQFSNQIKNRINMINKNYKKGSMWKGLMLIPLSLALMLIMACNNESLNDPIAGEETKALEEEIFYVVEEMPQWKEGGDLAMEMRKFIAKNLKYPKKAIEEGAEGKVFIHFLVSKTGEVVIPDPSILPPPEPGKIMSDENEVVVVSYRPLSSESKAPEEEIIELFKEESKRVIELMPDLIPGKQRGQAVNVIFTMPITFKLQ